MDEARAEPLAFVTEATDHFFVDDRAPARRRPDRPFTWIRGHQLMGAR
jgi:hypothetical protein